MNKSLVSHICDRLFVVLGALVFLQVPLFMKQYETQLIGHVAELKWQIEHMGLAAAKSGKELPEYIQKFIDHTDDDIVSQGAMMDKIQKRWLFFTMALAKLQSASPLIHPWLFLYYLQFDILKSTLLNFTPGLTFSLESALYALLGMAFGYLLFRLFKIMFVREKASD